MSRNLVVCLLCLAPAIASAQLEELENPGTVSAIQARAYRMEHELSLSAGLLPLDAFWKGVYGQLSYAYHFTDYFGWQIGRFAYNYSWSTGLRDQLERDFGVLPTAFDEVQFFFGSDILIKPFYGKSTLFNKAVLHYEAHFILGVTVFKFTTSNFRPGVNFGAGVRLFSSRWVSWKLDFTDTVVISDKPSNVVTMTLSLAVNFGATE